MSWTTVNKRHAAECDMCGVLVVTEVSAEEGKKRPQGTAGYLKKFGWDCCDDHAGYFYHACPKCKPGNWMLSYMRTIEPKKTEEGEKR